MTLTDDEIRIKLAEAMGWTVVQDEHGVCGTIDWIHWHSPAGFPKYPESLDACAEFEETLTDAEWGEYGDNILLLSLGPVRMVSQINKAKINAKPRIKCLAYLKTKGILP